MHVVAACDSGSVAVFASVFYLPPPRALNYMINEMYKKPTCLLTVRGLERLIFLVRSISPLPVQLLGL